MGGSVRIPVDPVIEIVESFGGAVLRWRLRFPQDYTLITEGGDVLTTEGGDPLVAQERKHLMVVVEVPD